MRKWSGAAQLNLAALFLLGASDANFSAHYLQRFTELRGLFGLKLREFNRVHARRNLEGLDADQLLIDLRAFSIIVLVDANAFPGHLVGDLAFWRPAIWINPLFGVGGDERSFAQVQQASGRDGIIFSRCLSMSVCHCCEHQ